MPPKRGRGRGRGFQGDRSTQDTPPGQATHQRGRGRGDSPSHYQRGRGHPFQPSTHQPRDRYDVGDSSSQYSGSRAPPPEKEVRHRYEAGDSSSQYPRTKAPPPEKGAMPRHEAGESSSQYPRSRTPPPEKSTRYEPKSSTSAAAGREKPTVSTEELGIELKYGLGITPTFPKRPGVGKRGRTVRVISNCYPINIPDGDVFLYHIEVLKNNPKSQDAKPSDKKYRNLSTKVNRKVVALMLETNKNFKNNYCAYDGCNNLYSRKKLPIQFPFTCQVILPDEYPGNPDDPRGPKTDSFQVSINSLSSVISLNSVHEFFDRRTSTVPHEAIMAVETILRQAPSVRLTPIGRNFFCRPDLHNITPFGGGLEIWFGWHQGVRLCQWKPTVNLDTSATTFWRAAPVIEIIAELMNMRDLERISRLNDADIRRINRKLARKQIRVTHLNYPRRHRVLGLTKLSARQLVIDSSSKTTVEQYFYEKYKRALKYPHLPCIHVQPKEKKIYLPIEVCELTEGQHNNEVLTPEQKSEMLQFTSKPPNVRFRKIEENLKKADFNHDKCTRNFGLEVENKPLNVDARVLNAPKIVYENKEIQPRDGTWNMRDTKFFHAAKIRSWVLISFNRRTRNLDVFADLVAPMGKSLGIEISGPTDVRIVDMWCDKEKLFRDLKKKQIDLAIIVIPTTEHDKKLYADIKSAAETVVGLTTQCIKEATVGGMHKRGAQIVCNLFLKINAKMGGENNSLLDREIPEIMLQPVIVIGADVNHPPPTQLNQPSIAACVGSLDCIGKRFAVSIRPQVNSSENKKKVEIICDLQEMVRELLLAFHRHTRQKPTKILFFRDGVSEGELLKVKSTEVMAIRKACRSISSDYEPGITFIVVTKRHHVRFMPSNPRDAAGKVGNVPPGTVVDQGVTHPVNFDFFLCSQLGLLGTSRPSHYTVVEDDNDLSADDLQKLAYQLCFMSARCTKSISIPVPVAYADLVAYRARKYLEARGADDSSSSSGYSTIYRLTQEDIDAIKVVNELKSSMYFV